MQNTRRRDTSPEKLLRSALHRMGLRFRLDRSPIPGMRSRADIVFPRERVAVFVDGCFWHRCPAHGTTPKNNREWWVAKLDGNVERDRRVDEELRRAAWRVVRVWEHEDVDAGAAKVRDVVVAARRGGHVSVKARQV
jgi:DNA mismatch endonuclease (patch repair protein)